jgi:hypothetical protein
MTAERRRLHAEAMAAFAAAREALSSNPVRGSPEWKLWQELCRSAIEANDAYVRTLASTAANPTSIRGARE